MRFIMPAAAPGDPHALGDPLAHLRFEPPDRARTERHGLREDPVRDVLIDCAARKSRARFDLPASKKCRLPLDSHAFVFLSQCPFQAQGVGMSGCCDSDCSLDALRERQRGTLQVVLVVNAVMFFVIVVAALYAKSSALLSDSLDNLGDALTYGLSIYAVSRGNATKARVALFKGGLIFLAACAVAAQIVSKLLAPSVPAFEVMGIFSLVGLAANALCLFLLWRHRHEDVNMSSVWECSRNDIASNLSVFVAAGAVWLTGSGWPDIAVASCLVLLLMRSAMRVIASARAELAAAT